MFTDEQKQKWELHWRQSWETDKVWIKCMNIPGLIDTILNCHKQSPHPLTSSSCSSTLTHNMLAFFFYVHPPSPPCPHILMPTLIISFLRWQANQSKARVHAVRSWFKEAMQSGHSSKKSVTVTMQDTDGVGMGVVSQTYQHNTESSTLLPWPYSQHNVTRANLHIGTVHGYTKACTWACRKVCIIHPILPQQYLNCTWSMYTVMMLECNGWLDNYTVQ